jgi:hypothetical protein
MIVLTNKDIVKREFPTISHDELEDQWREAKATFEQIQAKKKEIDRIHLAAANELNRLERLINKANRRAIHAGR